MQLQARQAFLATLTGDATLAALLAKDPANAAKPAIFLFNGTLPPVYPCVVYRLPESTPDPAMRPTNAEGGGRSPHTEGRAEVRIYGAERVASRDAIAARVRTLLEGKVLTKAGWTGRLFRVEILTEAPDQFDPALNDFYHLIRFRLREWQPLT